MIYCYMGLMSEMRKSKHKIEELRILDNDLIILMYILTEGK